MNVGSLSNTGGQKQTKFGLDQSDLDNGEETQGLASLTHAGRPTSIGTRTYQLVVDGVIDVRGDF